MSESETDAERSLRKIAEADRACNEALRVWGVAKDQAKFCKDEYEKAVDHRNAVVRGETAAYPLFEGEVEDGRG